MRCQFLIRVKTTEETFWIERENGKTIFLRLIRPTWIMQQCQITTRQKHAKCWRENNMCGEHAAVVNPEQYPKAKGHPTGGRHGLSNSLKTPLLAPMIEN